MIGIAPVERVLKEPHPYDELSDSEKALLYVFDNFLVYGDRARPSRAPSRQDCWLADDRTAVILDWDYYGAPTRNQPGIKTDYYNWDSSKFLGVQRRASEVERSCNVIAAGLSDSTVRGVVADAAEIWDRVDQAAVYAWLIARRNALSTAYSNATHPPVDALTQGRLGELTAIATNQVRCLQPMTLVFAAAVSEQVTASVYRRSRCYSVYE